MHYSSSKKNIYSYDFRINYTSGTEESREPPVIENLVLPAREPLVVIGVIIDIHSAIRVWECFMEICAAIFNNFLSTADSFGGDNCLINN